MYCACPHFPDEETEAYVKKLAQSPTVDGDEAVQDCKLLEAKDYVCFT